MVTLLEMMVKMVTIDGKQGKYWWEKNVNIDGKNS